MADGREGIRESLGRDSTDQSKVFLGLEGKFSFISRYGKKGMILVDLKCQNQIKMDQAWDVQTDNALDRFFLGKTGSKTMSCIFTPLLPPHL
jgi:hypothetical protein